MLWPFEDLPFVPWCQVNTLLMHLKGSDLRRVIMDLSWLQQWDISVNGYMPKDTKR